jgi:NADH:ubiquinone oxidoreductase subunit 4 (subunit M)
LGVIYASLTTLRQTDLKRIVAYSSVAHMGIVTLGIFTLTTAGQEGSIFIQIAHGIVSSGLFIAVAIVYDRYHTRTIRYYSGVAVTMPVFSILFFILTMSNIAVPGTSNFIGEIITLRGVFDSCKVAAVLSTLGMILGGAYGIFMFNRVVFGVVSPYVLQAPRDMNRREYFVLAPLAITSILLGVWPIEILNAIHTTVSS